MDGCSFLRRTDDLRSLDARARISNHRAGRAPERRELSIPRSSRRVRSSQGLDCRATRDCAHWLNWKCGIDLGAAREKCALHAPSRSCRWSRLRWAR